MRINFVIVGLVLIFSLVSAEQIYNLDLDIYKNDTVVLNNFKIASGSVSSFPQVGEEEHTFRIISNEGHQLYSEDFKLNFVTYPFMGPNATGPDVVDINLVRYSWKLPYFEDAWKIQLYHGNKKIFEYELLVEEEEGLPVEEVEDMPESETSEESGPGASESGISEVEEENGGMCFLSLVLLLGMAVICMPREDS